MAAANATVFDSDDSGGEWDGFPPNNVPVKYDSNRKILPGSQDVQYTHVYMIYLCVKGEIYRHPLCIV
jgi:hypothetical protein